MAGKIRQMIDKIIQIRSNGDTGLANLTKAKFILKGINPDKYSAGSPDEPDILDKIRLVSKDLGVQI